MFLMERGCSDLRGEVLMKEILSLISNFCIEIKFLIGITYLKQIYTVR